MNYRRQGLRALGLSILAALGMMAFTAAGAQAGGGEWLVLDKDGTNLTVKQLSPQLAAITGTQEGVGRLLILKLNLLLKCSETVVASAHIVPLGHAKGTIEFDECEYTTVAGLVKNEVCTPDRITTNVLGLIVKHNGSGYILFSPLTGTTFAIVHNLGVECGLPLFAEVKGSVVAALAASGSHSITQLITTKGQLTLFPNDTISYGANLSHLEADALIDLTGENHEGLSWGYHVL